MSGWGEYLLAWVAFLAAHVIPASPARRAWLVPRLGRRGYLAAFSLLSVVLLVWLLRAAAGAPFHPLWDTGGAGRWLVNLAMPAAVLLALSPPRLPGLLAGFAIWAAAHLVANGDLAHAALFGGMLAFAFSGMVRSGLPRPFRPDAGQLALAAAIWLGLILLHPVVIGVSPLPL